jgi:hypothetical protein
LSRYLYRRINPVKPARPIVVKNVPARSTGVRLRSGFVDTPRVEFVQSSVFPPESLVVAATPPLA